MTGPALKDRWMQGRTQALQRDGMTFKQAVVQAQQDWDEQERMHRDTRTDSL